MSLMEIGFELTNDCNLDCIHCLREKKDMESYLPIPLIRRILTEARPYGTMRVGFTGGEPTTHPDFLGVVDAVTELGYPYFFVTNGLNHRRVFPAIVEGKKEGRKRLLLGISLSIDGAREETHDALRGHGSFKKVIQAAVYLKETKVPLTIQMVVNSRTKGEIEDMARLAHDLQARTLYYAPIFPTPEGIAHGLVPSPDEWDRARELVREIRERSRLEIHHAMGWLEPLSFVQCRFLQMESVNVDYMGHLTFCCQLSGYRGGTGAAGDIAANLKTMTFHRALRLLHRKISTFNGDKLAHIGSGKMGVLDRYPCYYCTKYFGKLDWMAGFPGSPWARGITAQGRRGGRAGRTGRGGDAGRPGRSKKPVG